MNYLDMTILMAILSGFGCPVYGNHNNEKKEPPVKIVAECEFRDVTDEEEATNV